MPDEDPASGPDSGAQSTIAPSPGGAAPGQVPSGQPGAGGGTLPPAGAPGSQAIKPEGVLAFGRGLAGQGMHFLFMALKLMPPGEEFDSIHKAYSVLNKHFKKQELPQGGGMPGMPGMPGMGGPPQGGGMPGMPPQTATPNVPRGPAPMGMPA